MLLMIANGGICQFECKHLNLITMKLLFIIDFTSAEADNEVIYTEAMYLSQRREYKFLLYPILAIILKMDKKKRVKYGVRS